MSRVVATVNNHITSMILNTEYYFIANGRTALSFQLMKGRKTAEVITVCWAYCWPAAHVLLRCIYRRWRHAAATISSDSFAGARRLENSGAPADRCRQASNDRTTPIRTGPGHAVASTDRPRRCRHLGRRTGGRMTPGRRLDEKCRCNESATTRGRIAASCWSRWLAGRRCRSPPYSIDSLF